ncbi:tetratricopeptide repeat protein [Kitasatospora sp. NBC_00374]|uniref:tetratricopeptide repeat protein n=1 Tax=Kitasatospora sp. NBC_00374 TaxID=2975964 RepID=UPI00324C01A7
MSLQTGKPEGSREPYGPQQVVRAESGFAYGAVNADIHVFGDGLPLYLLENWRPAPETDASWLQEQPSRMLNSRFAVVGFTGRADELSQLRTWRESGPRLAARWLHGPGGQGKSRLAAQFAAESAAEGWKVVTATHGPGSVIPEPGSQDMRLDGFAGVLVIVDYADRWPPTHLTWLLSNAMLHQSAVPARVLLLARTVDPWPALRAGLINQQAGISTQFLEPLPSDESGRRAEMFEAARDSFATRYGVSTPAGIAPPGPMAGRDFGLTLAVHMAALVAVDAHVHGRQPPSDMAGLTIYLLDREHAHWGRLYGDGTHELDPTERTYLTPPGVMNRTVFTAALTGPLRLAAGKELLITLRLRPSPEQVIADHAICYPPASLDEQSVLEPLYPDRLAEDFLALTLPGHTSDYPAQTWASPTTTALLTRDGEDSSALWTPRAITFLAAASERWKHVAPRHLYPLLDRDPQLALDAGSAALTSLAALDDLPMELLEAIEARFPPSRHTDLDAGMAALTARLIRHCLATTDDLAEHARLYLVLAARQHNAGLYDQALEATEKQVAIFRRLVQANPATHEPDLADSLTSLGVALSKVGRREEALRPAEEALGVWRQLAQADPTAHEPHLARALSNCCGRLLEVGRREEALRPAEEAVELWRRLARADPAAHEARLATALPNLARVMSDVGRREEALRTVQEAVELWRRLARADPAIHEPGLASSLSSLGADLSEMGRRREAAAAHQQAVEIRRRLARTTPAAHEPDLATSLMNLGLTLWEVGEREEAIRAAEEALNTWRRLARTNPAAHEPRLAASLSSLGGLLAEARRWGDALEVHQQAVEIRRRLALMTPAAHEPDLAESLSNLGTALFEAGRREEALRVAQEAAELHRRLARELPAAHEPGLATSLSNLNGYLARMGRPEEALRVAQEVADLSRRLARELPAAHEPELAASLYNLGLTLARHDRRTEAAHVLAEAVQIYRRLADDAPITFEPDLMNALFNLGAILAEAGHLQDALEPQRQAAELCRRLVQTDPDHEPRLAWSLFNYGATLHQMRQWREALEPQQQAVDAYRRLARVEPATYEPRLVPSLTNLGQNLIKLKQWKQATHAIEEAIAVARRLAETDPGTHNESLVGLLILDARIRVGGRRDILGAWQAAKEAFHINLQGDLPR